MKQLRYLFLLLLSLGLLLAACGGDPTPTPRPVDDDDDGAAAPTAEVVEVEVTIVVTATPEPNAPIEATPTPTPATDEVEDRPVDLADLPGPPAAIVNDEGGPVGITGEVEYTNPFFNVGVAAPVVILEDQAGFVDRDEDYLFPVESQSLGQITSDFYTSPFNYSIALPIEPKGGFRDVDNDGEEDIGVQVFAVAYWNNVFGDPFLEERDLGGGGWSTAYASTIISDDPEFEREIVGGYFLVYAQDDQQGFPSGFGDDMLLFTEDDPIVTLPQGYTIVNLDTEPFTFDRSRNPVIDLIEPEGAALVDYSDLSYTEAFDALVDQLSNEYAFTEYKGIDWEALRDEYRPRFEDADTNNDELAYLRALRDFSWQIPDGHISGPFLGDDFRAAAIGGIGIAIRELDDGRVLVNFLLEDGPAAEAGMEIRSEILEMNGQPIGDYISNTVSYFAPYSTPHNRRLDQLLFATRFPVGTEVEVTFQNPGSLPETVTLEAVGEVESFNFWLEDETRDGFELPLEYEFLEEEGVGYVQIFSFFDNDLLTVQLWERMIQEMNENNVSNLVIDMRRNGGGRGFLADQMAAYFFNEPLVTGNSGFYDEDRDEFYFNPDYEDTFILPSEEFRYNGNVVVIVGPDCASACEFFSYNMTLDDRATIVGTYPTAGLGGSVDDVAMPADETFRFTQGRAVDPDGNIHIEGIGVVPDIRVPLTEETLFSDGDPVLEAAFAFINGEAPDVSEGETLAVGDSVTAVLDPNSSTRYTVTLNAGEVVGLILESGSDRPFILTVYDEDGELLAATDPDTLTGFENVDFGIDITIILEVSTEEGSGGEYTLTIEDQS
ncbi:S41 family peptidase [Candidatus Leptofilum sp.]|uniref:S41 family peptidase n=1 Tax=Candidatus Leptofilum sp. TaxID=3241576 RepID=UPI003B5B6349